MEKFLVRCVTVAVLLTCAGCVFFNPPEPINGPGSPPMPEVGDVAGKWVFVGEDAQVLTLDLAPDGTGVLKWVGWVMVTRGGQPSIVTSEKSVAWSLREERPAGIELEIDGAEATAWSMHAGSISGTLDVQLHPDVRWVQQVMFVRRSFLDQLLEVADQ